MPVKHNFVSGRPDNDDTGDVQPSHWNADHTLDGFLAMLDVIAPAPNTIFTLDASGNPVLLPKSMLVLADSPAFIGNPTAPTPTVGDNDTSIATTAFVKTAIDNLVAAAPGALDTLDELAAALGDDANFAATMTSALALKAPLASPAFTGNPTVPNQAFGDNDTSAANTAFVQAALGAALHGQCQLVKNGANIQLNPFGGNILRVNGKICTVPDAGVALAPTGLTPGTLYYIYATESGAVVNALEASTTAPAISTTAGNKGVKIKTGDDARSLVGMVRPITGPAFVDSATQRFVRSWFNDPGVTTSAAFTANRTAASASYVELNSEIRNEFLSWSGETVTVTVNGSLAGTASQGSDVSIGFDGTTPEDVYARRGGFTDAAGAPIGMTHYTQALSEGYHYATLLGRGDGGNTITLTGSGSAGSRTTLKTKMKR